jgi:hypothetical protein
MGRPFSVSVAIRAIGFAAACRFTIFSNASQPVDAMTRNALIQKVPAKA